MAMSAMTPEEKLTSMGLVLPPTIATRAPKALTTLTREWFS
jgi:hypothetical protein